MNKTNKQEFIELKNGNINPAFQIDKSTIDTIINCVNLKDESVLKKLIKNHIITLKTENKYNFMIAEIADLITFHYREAELMRIKQIFTELQYLKENPKHLHAPEIVKIYNKDNEYLTKQINIILQ